LAVTAKPSLAIVGDCPLRIWNEVPAKRLEKAFAKAGITDLLTEDDLASHPGPAIVVRADVVLDAPVVAALAERPGILLGADDDDGARYIAAHAPAGEAGRVGALLTAAGEGNDTGGLRAVSTAELGASYWKALRKRQVPYALRLSAERRGQIEWRMFMGTYKGATDLVTKWVWPWPAFYVTKLCARLGITPNMVTWVSLLFVILAFWWFWQGQWALGLAAGWFMTFLDTVDGKLARVTLTSSKFGNALDHGIDLVHPPFWYLAWGLGLQSGTFALEPSVLYIALGVIFAGYVLQRVMEGVSIWLFKIEIHIWRPIDTLFRQITARRNPNLLLLTAFALIGRPDTGLIAVAVWTGLCLLLHGGQLAQAYGVHRRTGALSSWMSEAPPR
jgi:phosphatidylglycerophosphate synthase